MADNNHKLVKGKANAANRSRSRSTVRSPDTDSDSDTDTHHHVNTTDSDSDENVVSSERREPTPTGAESSRRRNTHGYKLWMSQPSASCKVPRQTLCNRKRRMRTAATSEDGNDQPQPEYDEHHQADDHDLHDDDHAENEMPMDHDGHNDINHTDSDIDDGIHDIRDSDLLVDEDLEDEEDVAIKPTPYDQQALYPGARINIAASMLLIITFVVRHGLSGAALLDLLSLIEIHCLGNNLCKTSLRLFRQYFENGSAPTEHHRYCGTCNVYLGTEKLICDGCNKVADHFVVSPLSGALQSFFSRDGFLDLIKYPAQRQRKHPDNIEDVFDGEIYKERFHDGFFSGTPDTFKKDEVHISFQINTDGVALFKSAKSSVWPVFLTINELHPKLRFSREYRILCGMWFGATKPNFQIFMKPLTNMLTELYTTGIKVTLHNGETKTVKALLISACFDSPARCIFQNFIQFNGKYGCPFCLHEGKTVKTSEQGSTQTYPFNIDTGNKTGHAPERTHVQTCEFADTAEKSVGRKPASVMGVKGHSCVSSVPKFDIIRCVAPDYMHGTCLGIFKMLMGLWFDVSNRLECFSIRKFVKKVDARLFMMKPPNLISRPPQLIETHIKWWKASEYRSFFLYYAIPCLFGILPADYFEHLLLVVNAMHILLSDSISKKQLQDARAMLKLFCFKINDLYKPRYYTWNMHSLLHYCKSVEDLGPLFLNSCFWYEDFNGDLRHLFHGTNSVENQIFAAIAMNQQIQNLASTLCFGTQEYELYKHMKNKSMANRIRISEPISNHTYVVGAMNQGIEFIAPVQHAVGHVSQIQAFKRISRAGIVVQCKRYDRVTKRNNFTVAFEVDNEIHYGQVVIYIKCYKQCLNPTFCDQKCGCHEPIYLAIVEELKPVYNFQYCSKLLINGYTISHIKPVSKKLQKQTAISITSINKLCVWIDVGLEDIAFVGFFPNNHEKD